MRLRRRARGAAAACLMLAAAAAGNPLQALEPHSGSRNFTAPSTVPNYFSNESAPFQGRVRTAQPGADQFNAAPGPSTAAVSPPRHTRKTAASAARVKHHRGKLARGKAGGSRHAARATVSRGAKAAIARRAVKPRARKTAGAGIRTAASHSRPAASSTR